MGCPDTRSLPTLDDFNVDAAAGIDRKLIDELGTCRYLESATNILLIGPAWTKRIWQQHWATWQFAADTVCSVGPTNWPPGCEPPASTTPSTPRFADWPPWTSSSSTTSRCAPLRYGVEPERTHANELRLIEVIAAAAADQ